MNQEYSQTAGPSKSGRNKWGFLVVSILVAAGGIYLWRAVIEDYVIPRNFGVVKEGLIYRSGRISARLIKDTLQKHRIQVILSLEHDNRDNPDQIAERQAAAELNIEKKVFPLKGNGTGDPEIYAGAVAALIQAERENKPVLVRCAGGTQRTGGVIAVYRLLVEKKDPSFVIQELKQYKWKSRDTDLLNYLNENLAQIAESLHQKGLLDTIPSPLPTLP
jgi:protein tyrosine/serine phosphatase